MSAIKSDTVLLKWMVATLSLVVFGIGAPSVWLLLRLAIKAGAV